MTQNINGIDQDNDHEDMHCPRLNVYCEDFDKCQIKFLPEGSGKCLAQTEAEQIKRAELDRCIICNTPLLQEPPFNHKKTLCHACYDKCGTQAPAQEGYKCDVRDCGSNVSGWCQWATDHHGRIPSRCDGNDPTQHIGLYNDLQKLTCPCDYKTDFAEDHANCVGSCPTYRICRILKRFREPDLATRLEWLDAEDDALREGLAHEGPGLVHRLQDMGGFGSTSLRELSKAVGYSATMLSRCMNGKERFTAKLYLALHALYQKRTGILQLTLRATDLVPKSERVANEQDGDSKDA